LFGRKAAELASLIKSLSPDATCAVSKPAVKGSFIVSVGGVSIVALNAMPRPFNRLRELDIPGTAAAVAKALGGSSPVASGAGSAPAAPPTKATKATKVQLSSIVAPKAKAAKKSK
jgi:hypothetical protein